MTTKAERIFNANYLEAIDNIETWGIERPFDAFNTLCRAKDDYICRRTVNAILKECDREERNLSIMAKFGIKVDRHSEEVQRKAIKVVRNTCANWIKYDDELKQL